MILRHSYAHRRLLAGDTIREVQESLGHHSVKTTLRYQACIVSKATSPADPESQDMVIREMKNLLARIGQVLPTLITTHRTLSPGGPATHGAAPMSAAPGVHTAPFAPMAPQGP